MPKKKQIPVSLFVGLPCYGGLVNANTLAGLWKMSRMFAAEGIPVHLEILGNESLVQRGRNRLVKTFLDQTDCTHLMFIDADIGFNPEHILRMIKADVDIIGGLYPKKCINWVSALKAAQAGKSMEYLGHCSGDFVVIPEEWGTKQKMEIDLDKPFPVRYIGTGFMLIKREVFTKLQNTFPEMKFKTDNPKAQDHIWYFFDCGRGTKFGNYLSEDYWFCEKAIEAGMRVHMAPWASLSHMGSYNFDSCYFCSSGAYIHEPKKKDPK